MQILLLVLACGGSPPDPAGGGTVGDGGLASTDGGAASTDGGTATGGTDTGNTDTDQADPDDPVETIPGVEDPGDPIFRDDTVHELALELSDEAWDSLLADGRSWVEGELTYSGRTWLVGVRLKGNTSYDALTGKPALKIDVNHVIDDQRFFGMESFYLQNSRWDPSVMHEFLAYNFFVAVGAPAARAAYAHLTINDLDYGPYVLLEKQNSSFMLRWFDDDGGSIYEAGSFNHGCDLEDGPTSNRCDCFEVDRVGEADSIEDLQALCRAATSDADDWYAQLATHVDMDLFLRAMAAEMVVSHYDNYGWNINNFRIAHLPETGTWVFTPWSVDLAFGWYPWMTGPHCGTYGVTPSEYDGGYLVHRCWRDAACTADLEAALLEQADNFEAHGFPDRIDAAEHLIRPLVEADRRRIYSTTDFLIEVDCLREFVAGRAGVIRDWVGGRGCGGGGQEGADKRWVTLRL